MYREDTISDYSLDEVVDSISAAIEENSKTDFFDYISLFHSKNRIIHIGSIIDGLGKSVESVIRFWNEYDETLMIPVENREPIKLYIDSPGGILIDTLSIVDAIELSKTPVYTICTGCAYSGGFFIFISGHKRFVYKRASLMFHEGETSTSGDANKFRNYSDFYDKQLNILKDITISKTNITEEYYNDHKRDDLWMTADEAIKLGCADEISKEFIF